MAETSISGIEFKIVGSTGKAKTAVDKLTSSLRGLKTALSTSSTAKLEKDLDGIDKNAKKSTTTLGKLFKSVGRIGFYRAIRSALKFITDGFREGLQNAYQFSKVVGYDLAGTMDNLATKTLTMKNQLGSAFGSLLQTLEPILIQIISFVTKAANAFAQLFAIIGGRKTYLKAVDTMTQYGEAVGGVGQAAKEAMRYLAPFDELNVLPSQNEPGGGGGGASTPDYSQMFEVTDVDADSILGSLANMYNSMADWFESQDWKSLGSSVWKGLKDAFSDEGKAKDVVQALFRMIGSVTGAATGFVWGFVSEAVESIMQSFKDSIRDYNGDNKIGITDILTGIWNFAISPFVWIDENIVKPFWRGFTGALLGEEREPLTINDVLGKLPTDKEWTDWGKNIWKKFKEGIESGWKSIKEGWADFKEELYNIFIKPIVDAFDEFAEKHPKVAKLLGIENGSSDVLAPGAAAAESMWGGTLELDAEVTDVKDSIPKEKKTIKDFFADLFGTKDSVPKEKKTIGGFFADLFGIKDDVPVKDKVVTGVKATFGSTDETKLTIGQRIVNGIKAIFTSRSDALSADQKSFQSKAYFNSRSDALTPTQKSFQTKAYFNSRSDALTPTQKSFQSKAYFNSRSDALTDTQKAFETKAYFNSRSDALNADQKSFQSKAYFNSRSDALTNDQKSFKTTSIFSWIKDALTDDDKSFKTTSIFSWIKDKLTDDDKTFDTSANFKWAYDGFESTPWLDTGANFTKSYDSINGTPWVDAGANFVTATDSIPYTPSVDVNANIIGLTGADNIYPGAAKGGILSNGIWRSIPQYASGTSRAHGSLFVAGEAGPEVVGHIGGRTEVLNRSQLAATMYAAVSRAIMGVRFNISAMNVPTASGDSYDEEAMYRAMLRALNDSDVADSEITLDGDVLYRKMVQRNQMNTRMTGRNVLATA